MSQPTEHSADPALIAREASRDASDALFAAQDALNAKMQRTNPTIAHYYTDSVDAHVLHRLIGWMQARAERGDEKSAGAAETLRVIKRLADEERVRHEPVSE